MVGGVGFRLPCAAVSSLLLLLLAVVGCATERGPRAGSDVVEYDGYVFRGPTSANDDLLAEGAVVFTVDGEVVEAAQPYSDYPGYWRANLAAGAPFDLRITGPDAWPAVWAGAAPSADGSWFSGALFGADVTQVSEFAATLAAPGHEAMDVADTSVVHLIGSAWDGEDWDCAQLTVNGAPAICYLQDPDTNTVEVVTSGPLTFFVSLGLDAGPVTLDSGLGGAYTWPAEGGDVVFAFWFQGAPS